MSSDDSQSLIGTGQAADLRESQLLMINEDRGVASRLKGFSPPPQAWIAQLMAASLRN